MSRRAPVNHNVTGVGHFLLLTGNKQQRRSNQADFKVGCIPYNAPVWRGDHIEIVRR